MMCQIIERTWHPVDPNNRLSLLDLNKLKLRKSEEICIQRNNIIELYYRAFQDCSYFVVISKNPKLLKNKIEKIYQDSVSQSFIIRGTLHQFFTNLPAPLTIIYL